jgi:hypothetical protein
MRSRRWLVEQVARLGRSIVRVFARAVQRRRPADVRTVVNDEPASGPPAHWVERVRRGAPGLLEPSFRRRGEPAEPRVAGRVLSPTEREPQPDASEREYVPPQPIAPRRPRARDGASSVRKLLRRRRARVAVPAAPADASPAPPSDDVPRERDAATAPVRESADSPAGELPQRRRAVGEIETRPPRPSRPVADQPERSPSHSKVVEFEVPIQHRTVRVERTVRPDRSITPGSVRRPAAEPVHAELDGSVGTKRVWEWAVAPPAPRRQSGGEQRLREPASRRSVARLESSREAGPAPRGRHEPLSAVDIHPWPGLPPPLEEADRDVDVALRAWERQQRLDDEQIRL